MIKPTLSCVKCLFSALVLSFLLVACDDNHPPKNATVHENIEEQSFTKLSRAIYADHFVLDPHRVTQSAESALLRDLIQGLVIFDTKGNIQPAIAREWSTADNKTWLFVLDDKARWSNGEPVTAHDFVASWQRLQTSTPKSPLAPYLIYMGVANAKQIALGEKDLSELGIKALDDHRLQIQLSQANNQLPKMLAHIALLPTYQGEEPIDLASFISNGSYRIGKVEQDRVQLDAVDESLPFQTVKYRFIQPKHNPDRFDIVENPLESSENKVIRLPRLCTYFYEFNFNDPLMQQREMRQAIRSMISAPEISQGFGIPNHYVLPRTMMQEYEYRLSSKSSEQWLRDLEFISDDPIKFTVSYDTSEPHSTLGKRVVRALAQTDLFRVSGQELTWPQLLEKREQRDFQIIRSGWCADYNDPVSFLTQFHSASPDNKSGYRNPAVDEALGKLSQEVLSDEQRQQQISIIVNHLEQDVAIIPLFQYQKRMMVDPSIKGIDLTNTSEVIYSKDLSR